MQDILLQKLFEPDRWLHALGKGIDKDIRKDQLYQLTKPEVRAALYLAIRDRKYRIAPPHAALIAKATPGEFRRVFINEPADRVLLSIANDLLFETCPDMIHPTCKSYLKGTGCGRVVKEVSQTVVNTPGEVIGWKSDLSKYFDSVPLRYIEETFDKVEARTGPSALLDLLRDYYRSDLFFTEDGQLSTLYQSLKQGCAVAAFLADAILYDIDEKLCSRFGGDYRRYSDDMLFLGGDHHAAMGYLRDALAAKDMTLNPKKVQPITRNAWFTFLGFSIRGADISLSPTAIKTFQKEIEQRTIRTKCSPAKALHSVIRYLYKGTDGHCWANRILPVCNVKEDIDTLNAFTMDCLRAMQTGRRGVGGLGYNPQLGQGVIQRGRGRNVTSNRSRTGALDGYLSLGCMRKALLTSRQAYNTLLASI